MTYSPALFTAFCRSMGLPAPVFEYRFHPVRKWRMDIAWPEHRIALEVNGGYWLAGGGRHNRGAGRIKDDEKMNHAAMLGWRVLTVQPKGLMTVQTVEMVRVAMGCAETKPQKAR